MLSAGIEMSITIGSKTSTVTCVMREGTLRTWVDWRLSHWEIPIGREDLQGLDRQRIYATLVHGLSDAIKAWDEGPYGDA